MQAVRRVGSTATAAAAGAACRTFTLQAPARMMCAAAAAAAEGTMPEVPAVPRKKIYSDLKRATQTMAAAKAEHEQYLAAKMATFRPPFPRFEVGDAIELTYAEQVGTKGSSTVRGTVIARYNKGIDSSFTIINRLDDDVFMANYKLSSPLLRTVRLMRRRRATKGKRVKRQKLFNLWRGEDEGAFRVDKDTKEQWEADLERRIREELAARGRVASKKAILEEKDRLLRTGKGILQVEKF